MKNNLFLLLLFVAFGSLAHAQTTTPAPATPVLQQKLNPNTDPKNQQVPAPTPVPASKNTKPSTSAGKTSGGQSGAAAPASQNKQQPVAAPAPAPSQPAASTEKQPTESPAATTKRKLIADGYMVCMTHPDYGKVYCDEAQAKLKKGRKTQYFYIDEDGIAVPLDQKLVETVPEGGKVPDSKVPATPQMVRVNRWVSPVVGDFVTIPEDKSTDAALLSWGYKDKIFQYQAFLSRPAGDNVATVNRWEMPNCKDFILIAEHEISDAKMTEWGYRNKQFVFYAYKTRPDSGNYIAVNRWINTLAAGNGCKDFTLSVTEKELTDAQLISWGYTSKIIQFYVPAP